MTYQEVAYEVMKLPFSDFTEDELKHCINSAYDSKFDTEEIAPIVKAEGAYYLNYSMDRQLHLIHMAFHSATSSYNCKKEKSG